jgi:D-aspartate ligase
MLASQAFEGTMKVADTATPVVVLSPHHHGALGIFRSLGALGVEVYAVEDGRWAPPLCSRYCRGVFHWDVCDAPARDSVSTLLKIGRTFTCRPILIPADDGTAAFVQEASEELQTRFRFPVLPSGLMRRFSTKKELYLLCRESGYPTPETVFPRSRANLLELLGRLSFPVMLKGIDDRLVRGRTKVRMRIVRTADELLDCYDRVDDSVRSNLMIQEYIPGNADSVWMFNAYFNEASECLVGFTGRKLRQRPADTGITTLGICLRNETVENSLRTLLRSLGYRGIVDIGCRYDARDGQYKLLDVNPRIGCTFRLFVDPSGLDVVRACYLDLTGQRVDAQPACEGRKWLVENQDLQELPVHLRTKKLTLREWLRSLRGVRETAWFNWKDLSPVLALLTGFLRSWHAGQLRRRKYVKREGAYQSAVYHKSAS